MVNGLQRLDVAKRTVAGQMHRRGNGDRCGIEEQDVRQNPFS
jgi:hypothetical protein